MADRAAMMVKRDAGGFVSKRGRPTQSQVAAIDDIILLVARTLFLENGYAKTSMEAVASSAGVSKGTLYSRYPVKPDLFRAIVADRLSAWSEEEIDAPELGSDVAEYLYRYGVAFLAGVGKPEAVAFDRLVLAEVDRFPELAEEFREQGYLKAVDQLSEAIERAGTAAKWQVSDAKSVALTFTAALLGWHRTESAFRQPDAEAGAAFARRLVALLIGGRSTW